MEMNLMAMKMMMTEKRRTLLTIRCSTTTTEWIIIIARARSRAGGVKSGLPKGELVLTIRWMNHVRKPKGGLFLYHYRMEHQQEDSSCYRMRIWTTYLLHQRGSIFYISGSCEGHNRQGRWTTMVVVVVATTTALAVSVLLLLLLLFCPLFRHTVRWIHIREDDDDCCWWTVLVAAIVVVVAVVVEDWWRNRLYSLTQLPSERLEDASTIKYGGEDEWIRWRVIDIDDDRGTKFSLLFVPVGCPYS